MTSEPLFRTDAYLREATGRVRAHTAEGAVVPERTLFYPTGGGQPGDHGWLHWSGGSMRVADTVRTGDGDVALIPDPECPLPPVGTELAQHLDWDRRYAHMKMHTALHLLSVVIPLPVTGGQIGAAKGRLDFRMPDPPQDREVLESTMNSLVARDLIVSESWITDAELRASPDLVKTLTVMPPTGAGHVRLVRIGSTDDQVDLQPCGGTHVRRTGEIGPVRLGRIENKGKQNRRVHLHLT